MINLLHGDCLDRLRELPDNSVDAVVTDPPYGLSFMGKRWDYDVPSIETWAECLRVLKPGGHLLAFAGTRTQHRMAVRIEDAGFEIRDLIAWVYGSGFPKSLDVSKAIDKRDRHTIGASEAVVVDITAPATEAAQQWQGWGTALKPALEPITVARKPLAGTVAQNVLQWGTGGLNVDGCRVGTTVETWPATRARPAEGEPNALYTHKLAGNDRTQTVSTGAPPPGRWPANLIHDGSDEVLGLFPQNTSPQPRKTKRSPDAGTRNGYGTFAGQDEVVIGYGDSGSAARFFYCAKASKADRGEGNNHPTVKPTALMRYLCRLITPPSGTVLDPFMGSGSTGKAAILEGFNFIGIERESEYLEIARQRIHGIGPTQGTLL